MTKKSWNFNRIIKINALTKKEHSKTTEKPAKIQTDQLHMAFFEPIPSSFSVERDIKWQSTLNLKFWNCLESSGKFMFYYLILKENHVIRIEINNKSPSLPPLNCHIFQSWLWDFIWNLNFIPSSNFDPNRRLQGRARQKKGDCFLFVSNGKIPI